jgi:hypothetical protein
MRLPRARAFTAFAAPLAARTCEIEIAAVKARIAKLEAGCRLVPSDISHDAPTNPAHQLMRDADTPNARLWRMGRLDDFARVDAVENATGSQVDQTNPPHAACTDAACLCAALIGHTNDGLGGASPHPP